MDWRPLPYGTNPVVLYVGGSEVARMCERIDGTWYAVLNQHLHYTDPSRRMVDCSSFEAGKAGIETWAARHMARLEAEAAERWERNRDRC